MTTYEASSAFVDEDWLVRTNKLDRAFGKKSKQAGVNVGEVNVRRYVGGAVGLLGRPVMLVGLRDQLAVRVAMDAARHVEPTNRHIVPE